MASVTTRLGLSKPDGSDLLTAFQPAYDTTLDTIDSAVIANRGAYVGGATYHANDVVSSGGLYYMSTATQMAVAPPSANWVVASVPSGTFVATVNPQTFGAVGDGSTLDTTAVQAAITAVDALPASGRKQVWVAADYLVGTLTCSGTRITFTGPGRLIQAAANANVLDMSNSTDCAVDGLTFIGVGGSTVVSNNNAIYAEGATRLTVHGNRITRFLQNSLLLANCTGTIVQNNHVDACSAGMLFVQCTRLSVAFNTLRDPQTPAATFTHGISFDSDSGLPAYKSPNQDVDCCFNTVSGWVNAQAILAHRLIDSTIAGNIAENCLDGIGLIRTTTADAIKNITVTGNVSIGTSTPGAGRSDAGCGTTSGSAAVTDAFIVAGDHNCPVSGPGIPAGSYVGTVTDGVSFLLSSSPNSQVDALATATATVTLIVAKTTSNTGITVGGGTRSDAGCGITSGSPTVTDTSVVAADQGCPVNGTTAGSGIPAGSYVGTVTAGVSFKLSSSPTAQVDVNATATATVTATIVYQTDQITVVGNTVVNGNAVVQSGTQGGMTFGYSDHLIVRGNTISGSYCNGIVLGGPSNGFDITGNSISGVITAAGSVQVGIYIGINSLIFGYSSNGTIGMNTIDGSAGLTHCIRSDASVSFSPAGIVILPQNLIGTWTNAVTNVANATGVLTKPGKAGGQNSISGAATPVSGTSYRNNSGRSVIVQVPAFATTPLTDGSVVVKIDTATTPATVAFTQDIPGTTVSGTDAIVTFIVPPGCFWSVTATGATFEALYAQAF